MEMKKFVLKLDLDDGKDKRKALKIVSAVPGIDAIAIDMKGKQLTVIGVVDPVSVVSKLRKSWPTHIISVGPAKEPEKKEEPKKEEEKKDEAKKEDAKTEELKSADSKNGETKKDESNKDVEKKVETESVVGTVYPYRQQYYPQMNAYYRYAHYSMEENPNACTIS